MGHHFGNGFPTRLLIFPKCVNSNSNTRAWTSQQLIVNTVQDQQKQILVL